MRDKNPNWFAFVGVFAEEYMVFNILPLFPRDFGAGAAFPLTPALSLGERVNLNNIHGNSFIGDFIQRSAKPPQQSGDKVLRLRQVAERVQG